MPSVFFQGQHLRVRGKVWTVASVNNRNGMNLLELRALSDHQARTTVLAERESSLQEEPAPALGVPDAPGALGPFDALVDAAKIALVPGPERLLSWTRARVRPERYQLVPVIKALALPRVRLLLADDVGLGKTIEAILITLELIARGKARRILFVVPAGLTGQWQSELWLKGGLRFSVVDSARLEDLRRDYPPGTNVWMSPETDRSIVSLDYAKQASSGVSSDILEADWDLVVFDEAHYVAESGSGKDIYRTDRSRFAAALGERADHMLLLTATPHNGHPRGFYSLLRLCDPSVGADERHLDPAAVGRVLVRRLKTHIGRRRDGAADWVPQFQQRTVEGIPVHLTKWERALYQAVTRYAGRMYETADEARTVASREVQRFVGDLLRKRMMSSLHALQRSLVARERTLESVRPRATIDAGLLRDYRQGAPLSNEQRERVEYVLLGLPRQSLLSGQDEWKKGEAAEIEADLRASVATDLDEVRVLRTVALERRSLLKESPLSDDGKARKFLRWIDETFAEARAAGETDPKVIVFTEYADTLDFLVGYDPDAVRRKYELLQLPFTPIPADDEAETIQSADGSLRRHVQGLLERAGFSRHGVGPEAERGTFTVIRGGLSVGQRDDAQKEFRDPRCRLLIATDAASEGLNLQDKCFRLLHYDLPWVPTRMEQRNGRVDRYGQAKPPRIFYLYRAKSREEQILGRLMVLAAQIQKDLGSIADLFGEHAIGRVEEILRDVQFRGADLDKSVSRQIHLKLKEIHELAYRRTANYRRLVAAASHASDQAAFQFQAESVLGAGIFSEQADAIVDRAIQASARHDVRPEAVKRLLHEALGHHGKAPLPTPHAVLEFPGAPILRIEVPDSLQGTGNVEKAIERATFDRDFLRELEDRDRDAANTVQWLGPEHPLVAASALWARGAIFDSKHPWALHRVSLRPAPGLGVDGWLFGFIGALVRPVHKGHGQIRDDVFEEILIPVFVGRGGPASDDPRRDYALLTPPSAPEPKDKKSRWKSLCADFERAKTAAVTELELRLKNRAAQRATQGARTRTILEGDLVRWAEERKRVLDARLNIPAGQLALDFEIGEERDQFARKRREEARRRYLRQEKDRLPALVEERRRRLQGLEEIRAHNPSKTGGARIEPVFAIGFLNVPADKGVSEHTTWLEPCPLPEEALPAVAAPLSEPSRQALDLAADDEQAGAEAAAAWDRIEPSVREIDAGSEDEAGESTE